MLVPEEFEECERVALVAFEATRARLGVRDKLDKSLIGSLLLPVAVLGLCDGIL